MPVPESLRGVPLTDMVLRAIIEPASFVSRDRRPDGRREPINDWRARAVWEAMEECGLDPTRTFFSAEAMAVFDADQNSERETCPSCGSVDPRSRDLAGGLQCDDPVRWHALRATGSSAASGTAPYSRGGEP